MKIYTFELGDRSFSSGPRSGGHEISTQTVLNGRTSVSSTGVGGLSFDIDIVLEGNRRATWRAAELEELGNNPQMGVLPISGITMAGFDGYYVVSSTQRDPGVVEPAEESPANSDAKEQLTLTLDRAGTQNDLWLAVVTRPTEDVEHPFGNDTTPVVGIPANAQRVWAVDATSEPEERELSPAPTATVTAELGDVDLYDATALPFDEPVYLFDLPYTEQGGVDAAVFDTYGEDSQTNADGAFVWAQVFSTSHVFSGDAIVENGILRLTISEPEAVDGTGTLTAERWDAGSSDWVAVGLPDPSTMDTEWRPLDLDVVATSPARVAAQLEFEAVAGTREGDVYAVDISLDRGREDALIQLPGSETDPIPDDLQTHLDPIASESIVDAAPVHELVAREEVRP